MEAAVDVAEKVEEVLDQTQERINALKFVNEEEAAQVEEPKIEKPKTTRKKATTRKKKTTSTTRKRRTTKTKTDT